MTEGFLALVFVTVVFVVGVIPGYALGYTRGRKAARKQDDQEPVEVVWADES